MNNAFFFQTQQIPDDTSLFDEFKQQKIFFSYFQVDQNYYLFVYSQADIQLDTIYQSVQLIQELDSKQRKIRSLRGFFLYALEIMETGKDYEILNTNLQPFFWKKVQNIIRQNKKAALHEFLFGSDNGIGDSYQGSRPPVKILKILENKIPNLQQQIDSLQERILQLENQIIDSNQNVLSEATRSSQKVSLISQQGDSTLKSEKSLQSANLLSNDSKVNLEVKEPRHPISESLSEDKIRPLEPLSDSQQYNIPSDQEKAQNRVNFIALGRISEQEKIEIIQRGFQLQAEGKISLKKYYESTDPNSLVQSKGYSIKYESIRRTKLYQQLKPSNN